MLSLQKPEHWKATYNEQNNLIVLEPEKEAGDNLSVRVEIYGANCITETEESGNDSTDGMLKDIDRIRDLYGLEDVLVVQEPVAAGTKEQQVMMAVIKIPTLSMSGDTARIQVVNPGPAIYQPIKLFEISNLEDQSRITAYIYEGNSEELNLQARAIVDSIQSKCSPQP